MTDLSILASLRVPDDELMTEPSYAEVQAGGGGLPPAPERPDHGRGPGGFDWSFALLAGLMGLIAVAALLGILAARVGLV